MSQFPLNIQEKQDSPEKLQKVQGVDPKYYVKAAEINKLVAATEELYTIMSEIEGTVSTLQGVYKGTLAIEDAAPNEPGFYLPVESGTYINLGAGLPVDLSEGFTVITYDGTAYGKQLVPIELTGYATSASVDLAKKSAAEFFNEETSFNKSGESFNPATYTPVYRDTASTFSGWETPQGVQQNFQRVKLRIRTRSNAVTHIKVRITDAQTGDVLAEKDMTGLNLAASTPHEIIVDFGEVIENAVGHDLRLAFLCDQLIDAYGINTALVYQPPTYALAKYRINGLMDFAGMISVVGSQRVDYVEYFEVLSSIDTTDDLITNIKGKIPEIEQISEVSAQTDEAFEWVTDVLGAESFSELQGHHGDTTSTFSGWGSAIGVYNNFTHIKGRLRARATAVTSVYFEVRENNKSGNLLASGTVAVNIPANTEGYFICPMGSTIANAGNSSLWFGFAANQLCDNYKWNESIGAFPYPTNYATYKTNGNQTPGVWSDASTNRNIWVKVGTLSQTLGPTDSFTEAIAGKLNIAPQQDEVTLLLPSEIYGVEGLQTNIYSKNVLIPGFGLRNEKYTIDVTCSKGGQFERCWRWTPAADEAGTYSLQMAVYSGKDILVSKAASLKIADSAAGNGVTRKLLIIADSTVDGDDITTPLKAVFDADVMNLEFVGTRGGTGLKHEGRSGWTINNYATAGPSLYKFNVTGLGSVPSLNDVYTNNGSSFKVVEINVTGGDGYINTERTVGSNTPTLTASTLTKSSGSGPSSISYDSAVVESTNPFWNDETDSFDFQMYLDNTGQSMAANDWVSFQLGINDTFSLFTQSAANAKADTMWAQLSAMMDNIQAVVPGIRIMVLLTIPPCASQDAFGYNYNNGQTREGYMKIGWVTWNKKVLTMLDTEANRTAKRYICSAALNLDTDYNFPSANYAVNSRNTSQVSMQNNSVHPDANGNAQIADSYAGIIKYFA